MLRHDDRVLSSFFARYIATAKEIFVYVNHNKAKNTKKGNTFVIISFSHTPSFNISIILENHELAYIKIDKSLIIIINFSEKIIA